MFVDDSGRRRRITRLVGGLIAVATAGVIVVGAIALSGSPAVHPGTVEHGLIAPRRSTGTHAASHSR